MKRARGRAAGVVALVAALASGCALVVDGLSTDFSAADDGAAPAMDAGRQDATMTATDAADADSSAPPLPAPDFFAAVPLCSEATTNAWHLDCGFGVGGSVVVGNGSGTAAPLLTENLMPTEEAGSAAVYVAVAREAGNFIEGIDGDGGRTVFAITDAGMLVDLTTTSAKFTEVITMLSNRLVNGTMAPVISSKVILGEPFDSTNDIAEGVVILDASIAAVRPLGVTASFSNGIPTTTLSYFVNYLDGGPGSVSAQGTPGLVSVSDIQQLNPSGPNGSAIAIGRIVTGIDFLSAFTYVVGYGSDGGSSLYTIPDGAAAPAPATVLPLPYLVDDGVTVAEVAVDGGKLTFPLLAGRVDGGARIDSLNPFTDPSSPPNFAFDDPDVGPLRLRAVHGDGGNDELLVAGANGITGDLYLALYTINVSSFALIPDPAFNDAGFLKVPLHFPAQLGAAVWAQGACYVSLTLTGADAGMDAVVIRIAPPGSP